VWDAASARAFAQAGFPALATSSSAVAATLGYADEEGTPVEEMFAAIARIVRAVDVPVSADVEAGYGLGADELVERLLVAGAAGCNLEDSRPPTGSLVPIDVQADWLDEVISHSRGQLVINARIDVFLRRTGGIDDAIVRGRRYRQAGVDCVYPILAPSELLADLVAGIGGPVNALYAENGPDFAELTQWGISRITFGGGLHKRATAAVRDLAERLRRTGAD
jgi:2-methylisocitrate lyase-like PEP mutase family enzyme